VSLVKLVAKVFPSVWTTEVLENSCRDGDGRIRAAFRCGVSCLGADTWYPYGALPSERIAWLSSTTVGCVDRDYQTIGPWLPESLIPTEALDPL